MAKGKEKSGECPFCGKWGVITDDHIPPKSLFPNPRPSNLITVPACKECNIGSSRDDEIFRTIMALDIRFPSSATQITENAFRGLKRAKYSILIEAIKTAQPVELQSQGGLFIADAQEMSIDARSMFRVLTKIIRGLIYHHTGKYDRRYGMESVDISNDQSFIEKSDPDIMDKLFHKPNFYGDIGNVFSYRGFNVGDIGWTWHTEFHKYWQFISFAIIPREKLTDEELKNYGECYQQDTPY